MSALMSQPGAEKVSDYLVTVEPYKSVSGAPRVRGAPSLGMHFWGAVITEWDNPWGHPVWPYAVELKCYARYWTDRFLRWWDQEPMVVAPWEC